MSILLGLAEVEVARLALHASSPKAAMRRCRDAIAVGRIYYFGLSRALRVMGTCCWLGGRRREAQRWWRDSLDAASKVGADYEAALTRIEMGTRLDLAGERQLGGEMLAKCRAMAARV